MYLFIIYIIATTLLFSNEKQVIHLVTTNDVHGNIAENKAHFMNPKYPPTIAGGAAYYKYLSDLQQELDDKNEGILILDGGNFFQGTNLGLENGGVNMIEWMNRLNYTALVIGKDDFILGANNLNNLAEMSSFPFLAANINCFDCGLTSNNIKPFIIEEIYGVKVGILGIVDSRLDEMVTEENRLGIEITKEVVAIKRWVPIVKLAGADVIIILTSSGVPWDRDEEYTNFLDSLKNGWDAENSSLNALQMGYFSDGIDFIVSGGNSKGYKLPWYDPNSNVYISQNYGNGTEFGHIKLLIDSDTHLFSGYETVIANKASQSLLSDDFIIDYDSNDWIKSKTISDNSNVNYHTPHYDTNNLMHSSFNNDDWDFPTIGMEQNLDIITWNCEFFPQAGDSTIKALSEAIIDLDADILGLQEIRKPGWLSKLMKNIPKYDYIISKQSSFMHMAILYKKSMFNVVRHYEIFSDNDYNFAGRPPLQVDFILHSNEGDMPLTIINLHMKCCDSGLLRRKNASLMLFEYLNEKSDDLLNLVILGDWNDDTKDAPGHHCFDPFLNNDKYYFVTEKISLDLNQASYPKEPYISFLDHILISDRLLPRGSSYNIQTIKMGDYMGGYKVYESYISDHLPVILSFPIY